MTLPLPAIPATVIPGPSSVILGSAPASRMTLVTLMTLGYPE